MNMIRTTLPHGITENRGSILRYWFWNKAKTRKFMKRIFINEIKELLKYLPRVQRITRKDYEQYCPRTKSDGDCGFAVIIRSP